MSDSIFISDIACDCKENVECFIASIDEKKDKNNNPFCILTLYDLNKNKVSAFMFGMTKDNLKYHEQKARVLKLHCKLRNNLPSYVVEQIVSIKDADPNLFMPENNVNGEELYSDIISMLNSTSNELKRVALNLYDENKDKLIKWTAGKSHHHFNNGELLSHTLDVMKLSSQAADILNANKDLLIIAASLHDIGKVRELNVKDFNVTEYSEEGNLLGHLLISSIMVNSKINELGLASHKDSTHLIHLICSHHGRKDYGAIREPVTKEAFILAMSDDLSSKSYAADAGTLF